MIAVTYDDKVYNFGFSRQTASNAEDAGFVIGEIGNKPAQMIPILVYYAATTYNPGIKRKLVNEIFDEMQNATDFVTALVEEYAACVESLFSNNEQGNATWKRA